MNNIELATKYLPLLDEVYKEASKTSILEGDEVTVKKAATEKLKLLSLIWTGLVILAATMVIQRVLHLFVWETVKYDQERSQDLRIDRLDNDEALETPFAKLSGEFIRTKVVPETDAARIAKICSTEGITTKAEKLSNGSEVVSALRACSNTMDELEVPTESRILFITPTLRASIDDLDTTQSRAVLSKFSSIIEVPQTRMYTAITLNDGTTNYGL